MARRRASTPNPSQTSNSSHSTNLPSTATSSTNMECSALNEDASFCHKSLLRNDQRLCTDHRREYQGLYGRYKALHDEFDNIKLDVRFRGSPGSAQSNIWKKNISEKISKGEEAARLRSQVNRRFFSQNLGSKSGQNSQSQADLNHVREILKLECEVGILKRDLEAWNQKEQAFQEAKQAQEAMGIERARIAQLREDERRARISQDIRDYEIARETRYRISLSLNQLPEPPIVAALQDISSLFVLPFLFITIHFIYSFFSAGASEPGQAPEPGAVHEPGSSWLKYLLDSPVTIVIADYLSKIFWWGRIFFFVAWFLLALAISLMKAAVEEDREMVKNRIRNA
ncbi:uncharacterized protein DFL_009356 [Arthrobotrys flagrans]|uniref:Uncharacterized protein n=1 Tax=Arthrobotrys flagrans TaxID=97331 RepID=A0A436ZRQ8_ARTFL|nr:hypothetical protein DFL_009356 [Arthrobotrys flagrans]